VITLAWYETTQLWIAAATLLVSTFFIGLYSREQWHRTTFGWSIMLVALAFFSYSLATILYRVFGDYSGRPVMLLFATSLGLVAMTTRTYVLLVRQRRDARKPHVGDPDDIIDAIGDLQEAVRRIQALEPCPNPDCMAERAALIATINRLPLHERLIRNP
jgi:hypothetical protein